MEEMLIINPKGKLSPWIQVPPKKIGTLASKLNPKRIPSGYLGIDKKLFVKRPSSWGLQGLWLPKGSILNYDIKNNLGHLKIS